LAAALAGDLLANAMRVRRSWGWRLGAGSRQPQRPHRQVITSKKTKFIRVRPLCRYYFPKYRFERGILRLSRTTLESGQKGKFFRRQKFALLHIKDQRNPQNF
jgi:hypothetical protein